MQLLEGQEAALAVPRPRFCLAFRAVRRFFLTGGLLLVVAGFVLAIVGVHIAGSFLCVVGGASAVWASN